MRPTNEIMARILLPVTAGVAVVLLMVTGVGAIAEISHMSPSVGDIVSFTNLPAPSVEEATRLLVHREDQFGCVLDLSVLRQSGGSFVVESEVAGAPDSFRVHWAGTRTTAGAASCGSDADLILQRRDLDRMALAVGGYGVGSKRLPSPLGANGY